MKLFLFIQLFCLLLGGPAFAGDIDFYYVDQDDRTPRLTYRGVLIDYHFTFDRTLDGRLVAHFDFQTFGVSTHDGAFATSARNLQPRMEVALSDKILEIFELEGRVFAVLDDLSLVEFRMPRPRLGGGHYISFFYYHTGLAVLSGFGALVCGVSDLSYAAGALGMVSAIQSVKAYGSQRGCNVVLETYQWKGEDGRPYSVHEMKTFHQRTRYPPIQDAILQLEGEEPVSLLDLLKTNSETCAKLMTSQTLKDRPGL